MYVSNTSPGTRGSAAAIVIAAHVAVIYAVAVLLDVVPAPVIDEFTPAVFVKPQFKPIEQPIPEPSETKPKLAREIESPMPDVPLPPIVNTDPVILPDAITVAPIAQPAGGVPAIATTSLAVTRRVDPVYPPASIRQEQTGTVQLKVLVDERGRPHEVQVVTSSGFERLDEAAVSAVRRWQFAPATEAATPVPAWTHVKVVFQLNR